MVTPQGTPLFWHCPLPQHVALPSGDGRRVGAGHSVPGIKARAWEDFGVVKLGLGQDSAPR